MNQSGLELLAPGGSIDQAVWALRRGADAVYAGAKRFSARSHAGNLEMAEFSRLCGEAAGLGARVYGAINTLLTESELPAALELAWQLWACGVTALIVQDLGLITALRSSGPPVDIHASTQMAVHSPSGARVLADMGIKRVVLARELTLEEIAAIHGELPELELECFIYGSLCYGVSGLCLASGRILGRSGNRGDCGQICRTWSTLGADRRSGAWFSMNDLDASGHLPGLAQAGVTSFKIEGRMKSPQWTANAVAHFRALLDGRDPADHRAKARQAFGRNASPGYLATSTGQELINPAYAGNMGSLLGTIEKVSANLALVKIRENLAVGDGVMILRPDRPGQAWRGAVRQLENLQRQKVWSATAGSAIWLRADAGGQGLQASDRGLELRKLSDHAATLPAIKIESLPVYRRVVTATFRLEGESPAWQGHFTMPDLGNTQFSLPMALMAASGGGNLGQLLAEALAQGGDSGFALGEIKGVESLAGWFMPPSQLKQFKREWHRAMQAAFRGYLDEQVASLSNLIQAEKTAPVGAGHQGLSPMPPRATLSPAGDLPFVADFRVLALSDLSRWDGAAVLPLSPVWFDDAAGVKSGGDWLHGQLASDQEFRVIVGINNVAQIDWLKRWLADPEIAPAIAAAFADYGLNCANPIGALGLRRLVPGLAGVVAWPAGESPDAEFKPPLFISRACFRHQSLGQACALAGKECPRSHEYDLEQGKRRFKVLVRDCVSYVF